MLGKVNIELLIDTHVLPWLLPDDGRLTRKAAGWLVSPANRIFVSALSGIEIATKVRIGKLPHARHIAADLSTICSDFDFYELRVSLAHSSAAGSLAGPHRDPFDRLIAAQSLHEGFALVTNDPAFKLFGITVAWD